jgi:hypothetical protein
LRGRVTVFLCDLPHTPPHLGVRDRVMTDATA